MQQLYLICQVCKNKNIIKHYKWTKGVSTSTTQGHLWKDYNINKDHSEESEITDGDIKDIIKYITLKY